jgi:hypothetical protein
MGDIPQNLPLTMYNNYIRLVYVEVLEINLNSALLL